jgi:hypothetical protein
MLQGRSTRRFLMKAIAILSIIAIVVIALAVIMRRGKEA